jgi:hypothetical protein
LSRTDSWFKFSVEQKNFLRQITETRAASYEPPKSQEGEELSFCQVVFEPFEIPKGAPSHSSQHQSAERLPAKPRDCATHDGFESDRRGCTSKLQAFSVRMTDK